MKKVLETRTDDDGFVHRRRVAPDGSHYWTIEVPVNLWDQFNTQGRNRDRVAAMRRVEDRKSKIRQAQSLARHNPSHRSIARQMGVPVSTVRYWLSVIGIPKT